MVAAQGWDPTPVLAHMPPNETSAQVATRLGVSSGSVRAWRTGKRGIGSATDDRVALELGLHPSNLWPTWPTQPAEVIG